MALKFYKATTDDGGVMGVQIASGESGALLPLVTSADRFNGIINHRKFYVESDTAIGIDVGIDGKGQFPMCFFVSTGDAMVVGDILGTEDLYGSGKIVKATDSSANSETVNGTGVPSPLIDIKKVVFADDGLGNTYFRVGDKVYIDNTPLEVSAIATVAEGIELTFLTASAYFGVIDKYVYSVVSTTITAGGHISFWLKEEVESGTVTNLGYSAFSIMTVY